jgi:hypothetical protein
MEKYSELIIAILALIGALVNRKKIKTLNKKVDSQNIPTEILNENE